MQGLGGSLIVPSSLALVLPAFPDSRRTSAVATWAASGSVGAAIAPALGAQHGARIDIPGMLLGTTVIGFLALGIIEGSRWGWASSSTLFVFAGAVVGGPVFVVRSLRHPAPLVDLSNVPDSHGLVGYSLLRAGLAITPGPVCSAAVGLVAGRLADRYGARRLITFGTLFPIAAMFWMAWRFGPEPHYLTVFLPATILFSLGFAFTFSPLNGAARCGPGPLRRGQTQCSTPCAISAAVSASRLWLHCSAACVLFRSIDSTARISPSFLGALPAVIIAFFYPRESAI